MGVKKLSGYFSLRRFGPLVRLSIYNELRRILIKTAAAAGVLLLLALVCAFFEIDFSFFTLYAAMFIIVGIRQTGSVFTGYYRRPQNGFLLMLPASPEEKWLYNLLASTLGWMVYSFIVYTLTVFAAVLLSRAFFGYSLNPVWWRREIADLWLGYLFLHGFFFLGSAFFARSSFFKTLLWGVLLSAALWAVFLLSCRIFLQVSLRQGIINLSSGEEFLFRFFAQPENSKIWERLLLGGRIFCQAVLPLYCWFTALVKFREIEAKDAI
ncbi:MAG: hypothetical protein LBQ61_06080 [Spirochaetales bacterium]|jgi:hypothetical protein|nr:hypothetical protein [Spirochaetales bacterium]